MYIPTRAMNVGIVATIRGMLMDALAFRGNRGVSHASCSNRIRIGNRERVSREPPRSSERRNRGHSSQQTRESTTRTSEANASRDGRARGGERSVVGLTRLREQRDVRVEAVSVLYRHRPRDRGPHVRDQPRHRAREDDVRGAHERRSGRGRDAGARAKQRKRQRDDVDDEARQEILLEPDEGRSIQK